MATLEELPFNSTTFFEEKTGFLRNLPQHLHPLDSNPHMLSVFKSDDVVRTTLALQGDSLKEQVLGRLRMIPPPPHNVEHCVSQFW